MEWLVNLIKKLFKKSNIKLIEAPKANSYNQESARNNFLVTLKQTADLEYDDRNGYKIIKNLKLKDMI